MPEAVPADLLASCWTTAGNARPLRGDDASPCGIRDRVEAAARAGYRGFELVVLIAISPDGTHSMDHVLRRQVSTRGPRGIRMRYAAMIQNPGI